jgi:hypothetical protein
MPSIREVKDGIVKLVSDSTGIKVMHLIPLLSKESLIFDIPSIIEDLIKCGELIEVEYSTPAQPNRIKSFLLPKGSVLLQCQHANR